MGYDFEYQGRVLHLETAPGLFSPEHADRGTIAMLSCVNFEPGMRVMDLGCGSGLVGLCAAGVVGEENVVMADINPEAVEISRKNACANGFGGVKIFLSDGFDAVPEAGFDMILSNPPYQSDFSVAKRFIRKGFNRLKIGGCMVMVTKRLDWYKNSLAGVFGGVRVQEKDGYYIFISQKRSATFAKAKASHGGR